MSAAPPRVDIRAGALGVSLLLSIWLLFTNDKINPDGPLYLEAADRLLAGDWAGAYHIYHWPFFSTLVAALSLATNWPLEASAQVLNAALAALLVYAFIAMTEDLGADRKTAILSAFVILSFPYLNENRPEVIRDIGFWAFYMLGARRFLRFCYRPDLGNALAWGAVTLLATLFRPEGLMFLLLLPTLAWFQSDWTPRERLHRFLRAHTLTGLVAIAGLAALLAYPWLADFSGRLLEPVQRLQDFWLALSSGLQQKAQLLRTQVLEPTGGVYGQYAGKSSMTVLLGGLFAIVLVKLFKLLTPVYAILPLVGRFRRRMHFPHKATQVLMALGLINAGIVLVFVVSTFYLSSRFLMPLTLTLLPVVPFLLAAAHDVWQQRANQPPAYRWALPLLGIALVVLTLDGLFTTAPDKSYLKKAGAWLRENAAAEARIFTNEALVHYYSDRPIAWDARENYRLPPPEPIDHYDYAAIEQKHGKLPLLWVEIADTRGLQPIAGFENRRADGVQIYRIFRAPPTSEPATTTQAPASVTQGDQHLRSPPD